MAVYTQVVLHCGLTANANYNTTSHVVGKNAMQVL